MSTPSLERPPAVAVCRATAADAAAIARVLADAFFDDPVGRHIHPDPGRRARRLERGFREVQVARVTLPHGEVLIAGGGEGAALWMPPESVEMGFLEELRLLPHLLRAAGRDSLRTLRAVAAMDAVHPHEPHWYLPLMGVRRDRQGQGIGSALLRPVLERCDATGMPAYLEATSERSRALYERHGFELLSAFSLPAGGPVLWRMWREPGAPPPG